MPGTSLSYSYFVSATSFWRNGTAWLDSGLLGLYRLTCSLSLPTKGTARWFQDRVLRIRVPLAARPQHVASLWYSFSQYPPSHPLQATCSAADGGILSDRCEQVILYSGVWYSFAFRGDGLTPLPRLMTPTPPLLTLNRPQSTQRYPTKKGSFPSKSSLSPNHSLLTQRSQVEVGRVHILSRSTYA
jgi:hypothetical protein